GATPRARVGLQAAGRVVGNVFAADDTTPASNVTVQLTGPVSRSLTNLVNGAFRLDLVPTGTYRIDVIDAFGNVRATANGVVLDHQGQQETRRLRMIGVGTVTGGVRNPDGRV